MVNTETVPSDRLATSATLPAGLIATPAAPAPASMVVTSAGGDALRSMMETLLSGAVFFGSAGSTLVAAVTIAIDSSDATATLDGGPTTLVGTLSSTVVSGDTLRSMIVTVSGGGFAGTVLTPSTRTALPSFADTTICAEALNANSGNAHRQAANASD